MNFVKELIGGVVIMAVATVIGIAHNAVRSDPVPLMFKQPVRSPTPAATEAEPVDSQAADSPTDIDPTPSVTETELANGVISMERVRIVMESGTTIIIDARAASQYEESHIPGAISIPTENFYDYDISSLVPYDVDVIVYCNSITCDLGEQLAREMRSMEYERIVVYRGGWDEWAEAGYPAE